MCLIAFAWNAHPRWRLVLAANRDEFHARPAAPLAMWDQVPGMAAGRDLESGGTWLGAHADGRVAVVTNVRVPGADMSGRSRGSLVAEYLASGQGSEAWTRAQLPQAAAYRPFNLLCFDPANACYLGNHPAPGMRQLTPGVHGLSNADIDTPWPKTRALVDVLEHWVDGDGDDIAPLWTTLADPAEWPDARLPDTGIGIALERRLSAAFIRGHAYGTRASTVVTVDTQGTVCIRERRYGPDGVFTGASELAPRAA